MPMIGPLAVALKSKKLKGRVEDVLNAVVTHLNNVLPRGHRVWEMELYLKVPSPFRIPTPKRLTSRSPPTTKSFFCGAHSAGPFSTPISS